MFNRTKSVKCYLLCKTHYDWILLFENISESTARIRPTKLQDFKKLVNEFLTEHGACQLIVPDETEFMPSGEAINLELLAQLKRVEASKSDGVELRPCRVVLKDGTTLNNVYIIDQEAYRKISGTGPGNCSKRDKFVSIKDITRIEDSPQRIPTRLATTMYRAGESGMGYHIFTLILQDGRKLPCVTGGLVDFVNFPSGVSSHMVIDLLPHKGREQLQDEKHDWKHTQDSQYFWCLVNLQQNGKR